MGETSSGNQGLKEAAMKEAGDGCLAPPRLAAAPARRRQRCSEPGCGNTPRWAAPKHTGQLNHRNTGRPGCERALKFPSFTPCCGQGCGVASCRRRLPRAKPPSPLPVQLRKMVRDVCACHSSTRADNGWVIKRDPRGISGHSLGTHRENVWGTARCP